MLDELIAVLQRKAIDFEIVLDLLDMYEDVYIEDLEEIYESEIELAREYIDDPKDRPIFVFTPYFVSGDRVFLRRMSEGF